MVGRSPCCSQEPNPEVGLSGSCFCTKRPTVNEFFLCFDGSIGYPGAPNTETLEGWTIADPPVRYPDITTTCGDRGSDFDGPIIVKRWEPSYLGVRYVGWPQDNRCNCAYAASFPPASPMSSVTSGPMNDLMFQTGGMRFYPNGDNVAYRNVSHSPPFSEDNHRCWTRPPEITLELEEICTDDANNTGSLTRGIKEDVDCRSYWPPGSVGRLPLAEGVPCAPCISNTGNLFGSIGQRNEFELECGEYETYVDFNTICPDDWSWDCASDVDGKYFWLTDDLGRKYHVWYNDLTSGSVDPNPSGSSGGIKVDIKPSCSLIWSNLPPANNPDGDKVFKSEFSPNLNLEHYPDGDFCDHCYQCLGKLCDDNYLAGNPIYQIDQWGRDRRWCEIVPPACTCESTFGYPRSRDLLNKPCEDLYKLTNDAIRNIKDTSDALGTNNAVVGEFNKWETNNYISLKPPGHLTNPFSNRTDEEIKCILAIRTGKSFRPGGNQQAEASDGTSGFDFGEGNVDDALGGMGNCCHGNKFTKPRLFIKIPTIDEHWGGSGLVDCTSSDPLCVCDAEERGDRSGYGWINYWGLGFGVPGQVGTLNRVGPPIVTDVWGHNLGTGHYDGDNITSYGKSNYSLHEYQLNGPAEDFDCFGCNQFDLVSVNKAAAADDGAISLPSTVQLCGGRPCRKRIGIILILPEEESFYNNPDSMEGGSWDTGKCMFEMEVRRFEQLSSASGLDVRVEIISPAGPSGMGVPYSNGEFYCDDAGAGGVSQWQDCFQTPFQGEHHWKWFAGGGDNVYFGGSLDTADTPRTTPSGQPWPPAPRPGCRGGWGQCGYWGKTSDITGGASLPSGMNITTVDYCDSTLNVVDTPNCCAPFSHALPPPVYWNWPPGGPWGFDGGIDRAQGCCTFTPTSCCRYPAGAGANLCSHGPSRAYWGPWEIGCHRATGQDIKDAWDRLTQGDWLPHAFSLWIDHNGTIAEGSGSPHWPEMDYPWFDPTNLCKINLNQGFGPRNKQICDSTKGFVLAPEVLQDVCTISRDLSSGLEYIYDQAIAMEEAQAGGLSDCAGTYWYGIGGSHYGFGVEDIHSQPWAASLAPSAFAKWTQRGHWLRAINFYLRMFSRECDDGGSEESYNKDLRSTDHICHQFTEYQYYLGILMNEPGNNPSEFFDRDYVQLPPSPPLPGGWVGEIVAKYNSAPWVVHGVWDPLSTVVAGPKYSTTGGWGMSRVSVSPNHRLYSHPSFRTRNVHQGEGASCFCCECEYSQVDVDISTPNSGEECWAVHPLNGKAIEPALPIGGNISLYPKNIGGCIFGADEETYFWDHIHLNLNVNFTKQNPVFGASPPLIDEKRAELTLYHRGKPVMKYFSKDKIEEGSCPATLELTKGFIINEPFHGGPSAGESTEWEGYRWTQRWGLHGPIVNPEGKINNLFHVCDPFSWQASDNAVARFAFDEDKHDDLSSAKIKLVSTDGTTKYYVVRNDGSADASQNEFNAGETAYETASNFADAVTNINGHNGKITVTLFEAGSCEDGNIFSCNSLAQIDQQGNIPSGSVIVELKQSVPGEEGNKDYEFISDFEKLLVTTWTPERTPETCNDPNRGAFFRNPSQCRFINGDGCPSPSHSRVVGSPPIDPPTLTNQCLNFDNHPRSWAHSCPCKWLENSMPDTVMLTLT